MSATRMYGSNDLAGTMLLHGIDPASPYAKQNAWKRQIDAERKGTRRSRNGVRGWTDTASLDRQTSDGRNVTTADPHAIDPSDASSARDTLLAIVKSPTLTTNERRALAAVIRGDDAATIAARLGCAKATAYVHVCNARAKARAVLASI